MTATESYLEKLRRERIERIHQGEDDIVLVTVNDTGGGPGVVQISQFSLLLDEEGMKVLRALSLSGWEILIDPQEAVDEDTLPWGEESAQRILDFEAEWGF